MTKERANELIPIMTAYVEGRTIELYNSVTEKWNSIDKPSFDGQFEYRIKPEPKHVPYDYSKILVGQIIQTYAGVRLLIIQQDKDGVTLSNNCNPDYEKLMECYKYWDGSTIGQMRVD